MYSNWYINPLNLQLPLSIQHNNLCYVKLTKPKKRLVFINLMVLAGLLLVVELGLHIVFISTNNSRILDYASVNQLYSGSLSFQYSPHRYLGYYPTPNWKKGNNAHNSTGFRGDEISRLKPENSYRIVCIGGSTTYTTEVEDYKDSYPFLLQKELHQMGLTNIEVINAGVGNWSTWESLINLQFRLLDLDPDLLVVYHSTNDIQSRLVWPPEIYSSDNSGRRMSSYKDLSNNWKDLWLEHSNILRIISIKMGVKTPNTVLEKLDSSPDTYYLPKFIQQLNNKTYPSEIFIDTPVSEMLRVNKPIYFKRNMESIINVAKSRNIGVVLSTFAHCTLFENEFSSTPEYIKAYDEHNEVIKELAIQNQIACLDFAKQFPDQKNLFTDGRHVNEKGSQLKANIFAKFIADYLNNKKP